MVLVKMLMEIALPKMGELLVMMMTMISPSGREVPPTQTFCRRPKVLLPKFRLEMEEPGPESPLLIFLGQNDLYTRRWAPEVSWAEHNPPGRGLGGLACLGVLCSPGGPPPVVICSSIFHIFQNNSL